MPTAIPTSNYVALEYDTDMMSGHEAITDVSVGISKAFPSELMSDNIIAGDVSFAIGSRERGAKNALSLPLASRSPSRVAPATTNSIFSHSPLSPTAAKPHLPPATKRLQLPCLITAAT